MSLRDGEIQAVSMLGTGLLSAALFVSFLWFTEATEAAKPPLEEREVIEATLAYRKTPQKQPQKKFDTPDVVKPEGVSHDEMKKPEEKKEEKKKDEKKVDTKDPFKNFRRNPDEAAGKPTTEPGDFNGDDRGFAPVSTGDPWFARLHRDMNFNPPEIAKGTSVPIGCIHITPDGKIKEYTFDPPNGQKGDDDIQTAADASMRELKKARNQNPEAVPTHLLRITTKWLCFRFTVKSP